MVRLGCSRLVSDDARLKKKLKRKFGHRFTKVEVNDLMTVYDHRDRRDIDDSIKVYENNNNDLSDARLKKKLKRKFGHRFTKVEDNDLMTVYDHRDRRDIDDSMKVYENNNDLSDVDCDYLGYLTSVWENQDKKAVNIDASDNDPEYEMFWSSLKPYGTSCILEVSENNGLSKPIIYEAYESDDLSDEKAEGKWKDVVTESEIKEKNRGCSSFKSLKSSTDWCSNEDVISVNSEGSDSLDRVDIATNGHSRYALRTNSNLIDSKKEESNIDDDYAWCWKSNMLLPQDGPDRNMLVCEANKHRRDNANSRKEGKRYELRCRGNNVIKTKKVEAGVVSRKNDEYKGCRTGLGLKGSKAISRDRPDLKVNHEAKHVLRKRDNDTSYKSGNIMCFANSEKSYDARVEGDDISLCTGNSHGEIKSDFRTELIEVLRKPYNDSEREKLLLEVAVRKMIDRHIDLRHGRAASYKGKKHGKSYLDSHRGLKIKLRAAKDDYEVLNLLRGFFFWLQNISREDEVFVPWRDNECLAVLPQALD